MFSEKKFQYLAYLLIKLVLSNISEFITEFETSLTQCICITDAKTSIQQLLARML